MTLRKILALASLVLLGTLPFLGGVRGEFIEDDLGIIRDNADLREGGSLLDVWSDNYWGEVWGGLYRPLTIFSYGLDRVVWGAGDDGAPAPFGVHATNLGLNAACAVLLFLVLSRRFGDRAGGVLGAWFGAALFAVHPVHTEAVVHMVGRADVLAALFFLAAWYAHGEPSRPALPRACLGALFYLLSLLSKEAGAALPAVLLAESLIFCRGLSWGRWLALQVRMLAPYAVALAVFLGLRGAVLGAEMDPPRAWVLYSAGGYLGFTDPAPLEVPLTMTRAIGEYLLLLVAPLRLSADYSGFPHHTGPDLPVVAAGLVLATLVAAAASAWRRGNREPLTWTSFFVWTLLPVSNLVVVSGIVMAERVLYLPSAALSGLVAAATPWLLARHRALAALPAVVVLAFAVRSAVRAPVWADDATLFAETVESGRYRGHLALSGLADVWIRELQASPAREAELLPRTLEVARESVDFHRTSLNVAQLAWALERDGQLVASLESWAAVESADPRRRADVERVLAAVVGRADDLPLLRDVVNATRAPLAQAQAAGDAARAAFWARGLERILNAWVEGAMGRGDWVAAMSGCALLEQTNPASAVLRDARVPAYEGAIQALSQAGRTADARGVAEALLGFDPDNDVARALLGGG
ncbi:MAG: hypothetical protein AAF682_00760 [Planctomycetota bacterium]